MSPFLWTLTDSSATTLLKRVSLPCRSRALCRWVDSFSRCWRGWSCCHPTLHRCPPSPLHPLAPNLLLPTDVRPTSAFRAQIYSAYTSKLQHCGIGVFILRRVKDRGYWGCSSARSPAPPSPGSSHSSATFQPGLPPPLAGPAGPRLLLSPSSSKKKNKGELKTTRLSQPTDKPPTPQRIKKTQWD